jgi:peptidyl-prolyl cis-trans isomerase SurA
MDRITRYCLFPLVALSTSGAAAPDASDAKTSGQSTAVSSAITEDDIQAYYTANAHEFMQKEQIHLKVFQVGRGAGESDFALLQRFRRELEGRRIAERKAGPGAKPDDAFMQDWGWMDREALKKPIADLLFGLVAGATTDPLITPEGCFIFRVAGRKEAGLQPLSEVRAAIIEKLQRKRTGPVMFPKDMPRF